MDSLVLLAIIGLLPAALALIFRVSGVFLFLSVAAGYLLANYVGDDAGLVLGIVVKTENVNILAQFILLLLPVVLSLLLLKRTLPKNKIILHFPLLVAVGMMIAVLGMPMLSSDMQKKTFDNQYGAMLREDQDMIVSAASAMALFIMLMTYRHKELKKPKK